MTGTRARLFAVGHGLARTGFARAMDAILHRLNGQVDITQFAVNHTGETIPNAWPTFARTLYNDPYGLHAAAQCVRESRPDALFVMADLWFAARLLDLLRDCRAAMRLLFYCPVDGELTEPKSVATLLDADVLATFTQFGANELRKAAASLGKTANVIAIPLGVDKSTFYPVSSGVRSAIRIEMFGRDDVFAVLNANKFQPRKRFDLTVAAFAAFAKDKPSTVRLHLHTANRHPDTDVTALVNRFGLSSRVSYSTASVAEALPDDAGLCRLYNACDIGLSTSSGEGFGLVPLEHAACGQAQIVPDHSAFAETWQGGAARLVKPTSHGTQFGLRMQRHYVSPGDVAKALEELYADDGARRELATRGLARACAPEYDWAAISEQWIDAILAA